MQVLSVEEGLVVWAARLLDLRRSMYHFGGLGSADSEDLTTDIHLLWTSTSSGALMWRETGKSQLQGRHPRSRPPS